MSGKVSENSLPFQLIGFFDPYLNLISHQDFQPDQRSGIWGAGRAPRR
jgi:hypothetical protein